jgi:hypothetical protein
MCVYIWKLRPCFLIGCDGDKPLEEIDPPIKPNLCDSVGILKEGLHAIVHNRDGFSWDFYIEDSVRVAEFYRLWYPYPCMPVPDSLRIPGLELIISYRDKTDWINDTTLVMQGELVSAKRINDFPEEDPRNGENMGTFYVKDNKAGRDLYIEKGLVFRNENEWNEFLKLHPDAMPSRQVDFDKYTLVAQAVSHAGCGWIYKRSFNQTADHQFVYKLKAEIYGNCQAGHRTYHWVTIPKISPEDMVVFEFEPIFYYWPS